MPRRITPLFIKPATFGRCSEISMPDAAVLIGLNSPPSLVPGFMSNVSLCDGPPSIHSRMQDLVLARVSAARAANGASQPDNEAPNTPSDDNRTKSRRCMVFSIWPPACRRFRNAPGQAEGNMSMIQPEFTAVKQRPEDIAVGVGGMLAHVRG